MINVRNVECMEIANKSQGQTLRDVGIYLEQDFFSHGQLYVAMSRVQSAKNLKIFKPLEEQRQEVTKMTNVVYKEVLVCKCRQCARK